MARSDPSALFIAMVRKGCLYPLGNIFFMKKDEEQKKRYVHIACIMYIKITTKTTSPVPIFEKGKNGGVNSGFKPFICAFQGKLN